MFVVVVIATRIVATCVQAATTKAFHAPMEQLPDYTPREVEEEDPIRVPGTDTLICDRNLSAWV